jgi:hypothetical protein
MKKRRAMKRRALLLAAILTAVACDRGEEAPGAGPAESGRAEEPAAAPETRPLTDGLALWRADGFTLLVPERADIVPRTAQAPETWAAILAGPGFIREGEGGEPQPGPPAYRVDAATYAKPDTIELETWVAARLAERGENAAAPGVTIPLAGEPALRTGAAPNEAGPVSYWLERNGKVVEFRLEEEPESPLSGIQRHVQSLILSTFRWSGSEPAETTP